MKLYLYITIIFCSILLVSCGEEKSEKAETTAENTATEMPVKEKQAELADAMTTEEGAPNSDNSETKNTDKKSTNVKGSQNFDPNADKTYYDGNTEKGATKKNSDEDIKKVTAKKGGVPKMVFKEETYNFGTVEQGENVKIGFELTNTGTGDLLISNAKGSCGCTEPSFPFLPIKPNTKSTIDVTFKTAGREGYQRKAVTITSNSYPRVKKIYLEGTVVKKAEKVEEVEEVKEEVKEEENIEDQK